jgi:hypothetical protein
VFKDLERIKWYLWHGKVFQALNELRSLEIDNGRQEQNPNTLGFPYMDLDFRHLTLPLLLSPGRSSRLNP